MNTPRFAHHLIAAAMMTAPWWVHAEALHSGAGLASPRVAYAEPLSSNLSLRAETDHVSEPGHGSIDRGPSPIHPSKARRRSLLSHWYAAAVMRLTGGVPPERPHVGLRAGAESGVPLFGEVPYPTSPNDRFDSELRAPNALPYLGAAHTPSNPIQLDIGGAFARASLSDRPSGPDLGAMSQTALDHELAQLRDGIGRARFMRPVSLGMRLRF